MGFNSGFKGLKMLWRWTSLFIGAPLLGNLEEGSSTGDFESWMKGLWGWSIALSRGCVEVASARVPLPGNMKDEVFERYANALWAGLPLIGALLGNLEEIRLLGYLREMNSTAEYFCEPGGHLGFKSE
jgi:hypothetical protein